VLHLSSGALASKIRVKQISPVDLAKKPHLRALWHCSGRTCTCSAHAHLWHRHRTASRQKSKRIAKKVARKTAGPGKQSWIAPVARRRKVALGYRNAHVAKVETRGKLLRTTKQLGG
jgi:hypothetical protein